MADSQEAYSKIVSTAIAMIDGAINLVDGARLIALSLRFETSEPNDPIFDGIIAFESETEFAPTGPSRDLWSSEALRRFDNELHDYFQLSRDNLIEQCRAIVRRFETLADH